MHALRRGVTSKEMTESKIKQEQEPIYQFYFVCSTRCLNTYNVCCSLMGREKEKKKQDEHYVFIKHDVYSLVHRGAS